MGLLTVPVLDVSCDKSPGGRRAELESYFNARRADIQLAEQQAKDQKTQNSASIKDSVYEVDKSLKKAYSSLMDAVSGLLTLENGKSRVSKADVAILQALEKAIATFQESQRVAESQMDILGKSSVSCMNQGELVQTAKRVLVDWEKSLEGEKKGIQTRRETLQTKSLSTKKQIFSSLHTLEAHIVPGFLYSMSKVFGMPAGQVAVGREYSDEEESRLVDTYLKALMARRIAQINSLMIERIRVIRRCHRKEKIYVKLAACVDKVMKSIGEARTTMNTIGQDYYNEHDRMAKARETFSTIWTELTRVKANIEAPTFRSTRDNSLRAILKLLKDDDKRLEPSFPLARSIEVGIDHLIESSLGVGAIEELIVPTQIAPDNFAVEW